MFGKRGVQSHPNLPRFDLALELIRRLGPGERVFACIGNLRRGQLDAAVVARQRIEPPQRQADESPIRSSNPSGNNQFESGRVPPNTLSLSTSFFWSDGSSTQ